MFVPRAEWEEGGKIGAMAFKQQKPEADSSDCALERRGESHSSTLFGAAGCNANAPLLSSSFLWGVGGGGRRKEAATAARHGNGRVGERASRTCHHTTPNPTHQSNPCPTPTTRTAPTGRRIGHPYEKPAGRAPPPPARTKPRVSRGASSGCLPAAHAASSSSSSASTPVLLPFCSILLPPRPHAPPLRCWPPRG